MNFYFSQLLVPLVSCIRKYLLVITVLVIHPQIFFGILNRNVRYGDFIFNRSTLFRIKGKISTGLGSSDLFSVFSDAISFPGSIFFCLVIKLSGKKYPVISFITAEISAFRISFTGRRWSYFDIGVRKGCGTDSCPNQYGTFFFISRKYEPGYSAAFWNSNVADNIIFHL